MTLTELFRGKKLTWKQEKFFTQEYTLFADNEKVAVMRYPKFFSTAVEVEMLGHVFDANQPKLFKGLVEMKDRATGQVVVSMPKEKLLKDSEVVVAGSTFLFHRTFMGQRFSVLSDTGAVLFEVIKRNFFRTEADIKADPIFAGKAEFPLLVVFVWYLILRIQHRQSAG